MVFFCPACWKEIGKHDEKCPYCGSDITEHDKKRFEDKLINALRHPERQTVQRAVWILGKIKSMKALAPLKSLFEQTDNPFLRTEILDAFSEIASQDALELVVKAIDSDITMVRRKARDIIERRIRKE